MKIKEIRIHRNMNVNDFQTNMQSKKNDHCNGCIIPQVYLVKKITREVRTI